MRKLQYLFMTLSVLFLAVPAFAQSEGGPTVGIRTYRYCGGCRHGHCGRALRSRSGAGNCFGNRGAGSQSWSAGRHPATAHPRPGVYGVTLPVHAGHYFPQGSLEQFDPQQKRSGMVPDLFCIWATEFKGFKCKWVAQVSILRPGFSAHSRPRFSRWMKCNRFLTWLLASSSPPFRSNSANTLRSTPSP